MTTKTDLMTEAELAAELGVCRRTVTRWRVTRSGPPHVRLGRAIRYRAADVERWLAARVVGQ